jgi:hypothetical protein
LVQIKYGTLHIRHQIIFWVRTYKWGSDRKFYSCRIFCMKVMLVNLCWTLIVTQISLMTLLTIQWTQKTNEKWEFHSPERYLMIKSKSLWDMTSTEMSVVWITTSNLKLYYACSFDVVITMAYYCNIVWILYIWKCHMKHFVLYIEYYGNNHMCEIYLMDIFYTWGESISILLCGIREWFDNRLMRYCDKGLWLMPVSHSPCGTDCNHGYTIVLWYN